MNNRFRHHACRLVAMLVAALAGSAIALAEPPAATLSETLQKAIYTEETVGDLDAAIKLYEQVVAEGSVAVESQLGRGSTFTVSLPAAVRQTTSDQNDGLCTTS